MGMYLGSQRINGYLGWNKFTMDMGLTKYENEPEHGEGANAFWGGVYLPKQHRVIFVPRNSRYIGIYDIESDKYIRGPEAERTWKGGVLTGTGKVVFPPNGGTSVFGIYDPDKNTYYDGPSQTAYAYYEGGRDSDQAELSESGRVYSRLCPNGKIAVVTFDSRFPKPDAAKAPNTIAYYNPSTETIDEYHQILNVDGTPYLPKGYQISIVPCLGWYGMSEDFIDNRAYTDFHGWLGSGGSNASQEDNYGISKLSWFEYPNKLCSFSVGFVNASATPKPTPSYGFVPLPADTIGFLGGSSSEPHAKYIIKNNNHITIIRDNETWGKGRSINANPLYWDPAFIGDGEFPKIYSSMFPNLDGYVRVLGDYRVGKTAKYIGSGIPPQIHSGYAKLDNKVIFAPEIGQNYVVWCAEDGMTYSSVSASGDVPAGNFRGAVAVPGFGVVFVPHGNPFIGKLTNMFL